MKLLIHKAKIIDTKSPYHNQVVDILINNGTITKIGEALTADDSYRVIDFKNVKISPGWFDSSVSFGEPGFEDRETIANGLMTAAKSGFTSVALQPNTFPVTDNQSMVRFVKEKANGTGVDLYPIGTLTKKSEGLDLAELYDMKNAGAVAFGDYNKNIENANLLKIGLQYAQDFDGLVLAFSEDRHIKGNGVVNEGPITTSLGLKGIPALAEELMVARNLFLLEYTGGKLHFPTISSPKSVELIKEAKDKGLNVTCSISVHHLILADDYLDQFDTCYKVTPPLRGENDRKYMVKAVLRNVIDTITSDHNPIDIEHKKVEFDQALSGTIGLESAFGALMTILPEEVVIEKLLSGKEIFNIPSNVVAEGQPANLTMFETESKWTFKETNILSKSKNSAFLGQPMKGKVFGIINNGKLILNN